MQPRANLSSAPGLFTRESRERDKVERKRIPFYSSVASSFPARRPYSVKRVHEDRICRIGSRVDDWPSSPEFYCIYKAGETSRRA